MTGMDKQYISFSFGTYAQQSSTNGSFVASLCCDDNMDTFSLTNDGVNQSWSVELNTIKEIYWIFVSAGTAEYEMLVDITDGLHRPRYQCQPDKSKQSSLRRLMRSTSPDYTNWKKNKITIRRVGNGPLKLFEVKHIGFSRLNQTMVQTSSDSKALDGELVTYYQSKEYPQASWFLKLDKNYVMKWILLSVWGGYFEVHVTDGDLETSSSTLCQNFSFAGSNILKQNHKAVECDREMTGNTIMIKRTDDGPMRLFEVYPIICQEKHYGPNCAKCKVGCISCSPITGMCYQCHNTFYGDHCQSRCPRDCLNSICKLSTGVCEGCYGAFYGDYCQHACPVNCLKSICDQRTGRCEGCNGAFYGEFCNKTCPANCVDSTCSQRTGVCKECDGAFYGDHCQYRCPRNCFHSTCDKANGTCITCIEGFYGGNCELLATTNWNTEQVTHSTTPDDGTSTVKDMDVKQDGEFIQEDQALSIIVLSILLVVAVVLVFAVITLFKKGKKTPETISNEVNVFSVEFHRVESRNESELEEIPQNEAGDMEDEIITVEYSNLTSQKIPIDQFIGELPEKKSNGTLEKEFNVCIRFSFDLKLYTFI